MTRDATTPTAGVGIGRWRGTVVRHRVFDGVGTNPEELIAGVHAGCYSMQLSALLANADKHPMSVSTSAKVTVAFVDEKPTITKIALDTVGVVPGLSSVEFKQFAEEAHTACLVTRVLSGVSGNTLIPPS